MEENSTKTQADGTALFAGEAWFDPIEAGIRERVRGFIEELIGQELEAAPSVGSADRCFADGSQERWTQALRAGCGNAQGLPERDAGAPAAGQLRSGGDQRAASAHDSRGRGHAGVAQRRSAALRPDDAPGGGADRGRLPVRDQHAPGQARSGRPVQGCGGQGRCQPHRHRFAVLPSGGSLRDGARSRRTGTPGPGATLRVRTSCA